jgi:S-formylglutathione hydrolase FrmB
LLLLLHGSGGDEYAWDTGLNALDRAITRGVVPPVAAVAPCSGTSWWVDGGEAVETAVLGELLPSLVERYGVGASGLVVAGFSMGGFGAVRYALRHPARFVGAIALSASIYDDLPPTTSSARNSGAFGTPFDARRWRSANYPALLVRYLEGRHRVPLYLAAGDDDWNEPEGWRFNVEFQTVVLYERLHKVSGSPARLKIDAGGHDWGFWCDAFVDGLAYVLSAADRPSDPDGRCSS